jgi:ferrous iron transport protein A
MPNIGLDCLGMGAQAKITGISGCDKGRLLSMGLVRGSIIKMIRAAPAGDPIEFEVRGYNISLRRSEARNVMVEVIE